MRAGRAGLLFCLVYFTSYITRKSFGAIKLGLPAGALSDEEIGLIGSALFFAYGAGQLISGFLGDRIDPRRLILWGLGATAVCNAALPFAIGRAPLGVLVLLWAVNGFAQAMFWPPLVKLMSVYFDRDGYTRVCMWVSMAAQVALLCIFGAAALFIRLAAWWGIFVLATVLSALTAAALIVGFGVLEKRFPGVVRASMVRPTPQEVSASTKKMALWPIILASGLLLVFVMTTTLGFLRDGLEEWVSTYLCDTFDLEADLSTLTNVLMPVFSLGCVKLATFLYLKVFKSEIRLSACVMLVATVALGALALFCDTSLWLSLVLVVVVIGCVHATNTTLTCYLPAGFVKTGRVSTVAGLVNTFTYVGSTVATTALPRITGQTSSWALTMLVCAAVALLCLVSSLLLLPRWMRWSKSQEAQE
jgi:OPA family glycerol-3-phosphate transporter-like MFS transporter